MSAILSSDEVRRHSVNVIELGKKSILDGLGLALAGSRAESGPIPASSLSNPGHALGSQRLLAPRKKLPLDLPRLVNGISIHADDFDDTQLAAAKGPRVWIADASNCSRAARNLCACEQRAINGKSDAGVFTWVLKSNAKSRSDCAATLRGRLSHYGNMRAIWLRGGLRQLLNFDLFENFKTFGLAAAIREVCAKNFGTHDQAVSAGHAAESESFHGTSGLGWTAAEQILEADRGFFHAAGGSYDATAIMDRLGNPWTLPRPSFLEAISLRLLTHPAMTNWRG